MPQNIDSLDNADVYQALQQQTEIVSVIPVTQALTPTGLLMKVQTFVKKRMEQPDSQNTALLTDSETWVPPMPMSGGGQPDLKNTALLSDFGGWVLPAPSSGGGQPDLKNVALLSDFGGWVPSVPMSGGGQPVLKFSTFLVAS
ncbi:hypothetical protein [uncultured Shewanella sp.]|uniref:hypothetical protein n=1 Tax=uncultured Shewanella sp. TaxID=173975 RepID=UPI0026310B90|nr:hypothetical protein [uncultured Shewanella sp.]